jgi:hypothetical protein
MKEADKSRDKAVDPVASTPAGAAAAAAATALRTRSCLLAEADEGRCPELLLLPVPKLLLFFDSIVGDLGECGVITSGTGDDCAEGIPSRVFSSMSS